jgi:hypothetical protein
VLGNWILGNEAADDGGGVLVRNSDVHLVNNIVADNRSSGGSGLCIYSSSPRLLHTTISRNVGAGVHITGSGSTVALTNTILVSHTVGITVVTDNTATLEATLWGTDTWANDTNWGGGGETITGTVNLWDYPVFVNPDAGRYHILSDSAAIDVGVPAGVTTDIAGNPRPRDGDRNGVEAVDIGAAEYYGRIYLPIVLKYYPPIDIGGIMCRVAVEDADPYKIWLHQRHVDARFTSLGLTPPLYAKVRAIDLVTGAEWGNWVSLAVDSFDNSDGMRDWEICDVAMKKTIRQALCAGDPRCDLDEIVYIEPPEQRPPRALRFVIEGG